MATVLIPTPLRRFTENTSKVDVLSTKVKDAIIEVTEKFPDLKNYLLGPDGNIPSFINIFVDDNDIRYLEKEETKVNEGTVVNIVPAIAGGLF